MKKSILLLFFVAVVATAWLALLPPGVSVPTAPAVTVASSANATVETATVSAWAAPPPERAMAAFAGAQAEGFCSDVIATALATAEGQEVLLPAEIVVGSTNVVLANSAVVKLQGCHPLRYV